MISVFVATSTWAAFLFSFLLSPLLLWWQVSCRAPITNKLLVFVVVNKFVWGRRKWSCWAIAALLLCCQLGFGQSFHFLVTVNLQAFASSSFFLATWSSTRYIISLYLNDLREKIMTGYDWYWLLRINTVTVHFWSVMLAQWLLGHTTCQTLCGLTPLFLSHVQLHINLSFILQLMYGINVQAIKCWEMLGPRSIYNPKHGLHNMSNSHRGNTWITTYEHREKKTPTSRSSNVPTMMVHQKSVWIISNGLRFVFLWTWDININILYMLLDFIFILLLWNFASPPAKFELE